MICLDVDCSKRGGCKDIKYKRYFLPFIFTPATAIFPEVFNFYYFPLVVGFSAFILFWNFPKIVYYTASRPLYYEDLFIDDSVSLYPNPSKGSFKISSATSNVEIFDLNGKRVRVFKGNFDANHAFTTQGIETGLYLLITKNEKGKILKKLIVE